MEQALWFGMENKIPLGTYNFIFTSIYIEEDQVFIIRNEIDLTSLLNVKDKNFYLPRCNGDDLEFCLFEGENSLTQGRFNILEPTGKKIDPTILDIIYIPALMANKKCYRLGYGKGFYDRFFAFNEIKAKKVIVVAFNLISNEFVQDDLDFQCDEIISEK